MQTDWPRLAAVLAARLPRRALHPAVRIWTKGSPRGSWAVAFSGGADSLALLLVLWAHFPEQRKKLVALHFNHRLRGRAATADEKFCVRVCVALGVRCYVGRWQRPAKTASESEARAARFAFFEREQKRLRAPALWLGHQQDDIAETMLMRLARGSGTAGLAAPRPVQPMPGGRTHLRPLLTLKKRELTAALLAVDAPWREDATNAGGDYFRNRVRRSVLPAWRRAATDRDALAGAALARERLEEDDAALETWVQRLALLDHGDRRLHVAALAGVPRAVARRALHRWLLAQPDTGELSRQGFDVLLAAAEHGNATRFSLGRAGFAVIRRGWLVYERTRRLKK